MDKSKIAWTESTWNPVSGCTKVSPGCDRCYAETLAERFRGTPGHYYEQGFDVTLRPEKLDAPLRWTTPRRIFVNSMSDLFHKDIPDAYIDQVFAVMARAPRHVFQLLTKRPDRMRNYIHNMLGRTLTGHDGATTMLAQMPEHIWLGVTIESGEYAWRAEMLRDTPAAVRFVSAEPLIGAVDAMALTDIDWVICGGESGFGSRLMEESWARTLRDRCAAAGVAFFLKQMGAAWASDNDVPGKAESLQAIPSDLRVRQYPH